MPWYFLAGIYVLFWVFTLFLVLPFGIRSADEAGERELPGQAHGAPHEPHMRKRLLWTTLISAVLFGLFALNVWQGWLTYADIDSWLPKGLD